ncbi:alcohol dehydrogenase catalytic domain-containing protein [Agromyces sp. CFH 90414]|uniref:Alcohol dehydrogenase catalytic domain-containing protein n=1 Tax=Agromyces agglutinans TaxID=2662258 RepID=A0A6I2FBN0_9MICO|nr:alcohol dehydrogenase catalytic domain-containing protein [Agromyces agglutinans]MRG60110.1 alcohol dehydrogenase catalytic domain-containing protein [Agromyces agglutinans]
MRAVRYAGFGAEPEVVDVDRPNCPPRGAIVRVRASGLCRSDWHAWMGHDDTVSLPHVPGHEFAGEVLELGSEIPADSGWQVGDRVTAPFISACGRCAQCRSGNEQVCDAQQQPGFTYWGSFAEEVIVHEAELNLVKLPDALGFVEAASLGCRFATAYRAVITRGRLQPGERIAVHGCGGVGLSAIMIAVAAGVETYGVDVSDAALEAVEKLGAIPVRGGEGAAERVREVSEGGVEVSVDAFGSIETSLASVRSLRKRGRHVQIGLMTGDAALAAMPMDAVIAGELELLGSHGMTVREYPEMLGAVVTGAFRPIELVGRTIRLDDVPAALAAMGAGGGGSGMTVVELN